MTQFFNRTFVVSTRALFNLLLVALLTATAAQTALASSPVAPVLVPYTINSIAGNTQSSTAGYGGDGGLGSGATLKSPFALAVDTVGNVYIADTGNALIREVNALTGDIQTIAGIAPTGCVGTVCTTVNTACSDGVPAVGNGIGGKIEGIAVDGYGNVYFGDYTYQGVWVIYKGGTQVANFITLVDAASVKAAGGVKPGYIYHIAGNATYKTGGCTSVITPSGAAVNNVLATSGYFHDPLNIDLDGAGNIYVQDYGNSLVWVINTQSTTQTFFGVSVQPGYIASIVNCNKAYNTPCGTSTQFGVPAAQAYINTLAGMSVDQFGNVYQIDTKGAPSIYAGVAYAGGNKLSNLINLESGSSPVAGDWYAVINNINSTVAPTVAPVSILANGSNDLVLRPSSITVDPLANIYLLDYHWIMVYRVDVNSQVATRLLGLTAPPVGTKAAPVYCSGTSGPQTYDAYGDGCPAIQSKLNSGGTGYLTFDGAGNLYISDIGNNIVRKVSVNTQFPATTLGTAVTQSLQVHFDQSNLPTVSGTTTTAFTILSGIKDFVVGTASCTNNTTALDTSLDCVVPVTFTPSQSGLRQATLVATTANGTYNFALNGIGNGSQLAIDGGSQSVVAATGISKAVDVAVGQNGTIYVADTGNNRVVVRLVSGAQTTIGTGLSAPKGVAVDAAGNVYISDTGNNRVVEVVASSGAQQVLTSAVSGPQGLAVDAVGNVYVADAGNHRVVQISPYGELGVAPMLAYTGAQTLISPVAVAVDAAGNIYVADAGNSAGIIKIAPGGGDLQTSGTGSVPSATSLIGFGYSTLSTPDGIAVDAAGNLYVSDSTGDQVYEIPSGSGPGSQVFTLGFTGLNSPGGLALDANGNLYVANTNSNQILMENRNQVLVNFPAISEFLSETIPLTVTNIGNLPLTPAIPFTKATGSTANFGEADTCNAAGFGQATQLPGIHCSLTPSFLPVTSGPLAETVSVQGGTNTLQVTGTGITVAASIVMSETPVPATLKQGGTATVTATLTQPHGTNIPSGTVTFAYTMNGVAQTPVTQPLVAGSNSSAATLIIGGLLQGRTYIVTATYNGDIADSVTVAPAFSFNVPGLPLTAVASSVSYTYGGAVPTLTGTLTGILPADAAAITVSWVSGATTSSPAGTYPIQVQLSGGKYQDYAVPTTLTPAGAPAVVTENPAPLTVVVAPVSTVYGSTDVQMLNYTAITGWVNGDTPSAVTFAAGGQTDVHTKLLNVGAYTAVPTVHDIAGGYDRITNYKQTITNGTITVAQAPSTASVSTALPAVLPTNLTTATVTISAITAVAAGQGTPTGTVTLTDVFTPLTATGSAAAITEAPIVLNLASGAATYTPSDQTLGSQSYSVVYSGDSNFIASSTLASATLLVDVADFSISGTSTPIQVLPGVVPGGGTTGGQQAAYVEQATISITPILGSTEVVNLTCASPSAYVTCSLSPTSLTMTGTKALTSVISISTPATLPLGTATSQLLVADSRSVLAYLPLGALVIIPLYIRRRRTWSKLLMMALAMVAISAGLSSCGATHVSFFTPVPVGEQTVTVTATSGGNSRSITLNINIE